MIKILTSALLNSDIAKTEMFVSRRCAMTSMNVRMATMEAANQIPTVTTPW